MKDVIRKPIAKTTAPASIYRIKAGPEVVTKFRNRRFDDKKKKASSRYCRDQGKNPEEVE
ncbi:MAG: hypothetical protein M0Z61_03240 [Nitrospiraceae bacterium]|nr:hypothetical protein [Nitrospiraceae bacterium]